MRLQSEMIGLTSNQFNRLISYLRHEPRFERVWVFGSRADGRYGPHSDVDLLLSLRNLPGQDDSETLILMDHIERWRTEMTLLLGIKVRDIYLEKIWPNCRRELIYAKGE